MKKLLLFLSVTVVISAFLTGCSSDDDDTVSRIYGTWGRIHSYSGTYSAAYEFKSDWTWKYYITWRDYENKNVSSSGTYKFDGQYIIFGNGLSYEVEFLGNGRMKLQDLEYQKIN